MSVQIDLGTAVAALGGILALSVGYYLLKRNDWKKAKDPKQSKKWSLKPEDEQPTMPDLSKIGVPDPPDPVATQLKRIADSLSPVQGGAPAVRLIALADQYDATAKLFPQMTLPVGEVAKSIRAAVEEKPVG